MEGGGLLEFWLKQYSDDATYCLTKIRRQMKEKRGKRRLTLNNLSGAFLVLIIGYVLSIIAFIIELCTARRQRRIKNKAAIVVATLAKVIQNSEDVVISIVVPENNNTSVAAKRVKSGSVIAPKRLKTLRI